MTLREALDKFHQENSNIIPEAVIDFDAKDFFVCHDIAHVIFGCDTTVRGEGAVKLWTVFGTTLGFVDHIKGYGEVNAFELAQHFTLKEKVVGGIKVVMLLPAIIMGARKMTAKWPWSSFDEYLDTPLDEIRTQFNIEPLST